MQQKHAASPLHEKYWSQSSAGKILTTIFWDCSGILLIDNLSKNTTTGLYYAALLVKLCDSIKRKRRGMITKGLKFCMKTIQCTSHNLRSTLFLTVASNKSIIQPTVQTWHLVIITCSYILNQSCMDEDFWMMT